MKCENCGSDTHRIYGFYWDAYNGWICFDCYKELKEEIED